MTRKVQAGVCGLGHQSLNKSFGGGVLELVVASVLLHSDLKLQNPTHCHVSASPFDLSICCIAIRQFRLSSIPICADGRRWF